jgi:hypothetical protein
MVGNASAVKSTVMHKLQDARRMALKQYLPGFFVVGLLMASNVAQARTFIKQ